MLNDVISKKINKKKDLKKKIAISTRQFDF